MAKKKATDTKGLAGIPVYGSKAASGKDIRLNKKVKPKKLKGGYNYLGDVETVTVPKQWLSSPDHVVAELAYITPAEQKILLDANIYGSLDGKPNRGPGGLMSLQGDFGGGNYGGGAGDDKAGTDSAADAAKDAGASNTSQASSSSSSSSDDYFSEMVGNDEEDYDYQDIEQDKALASFLSGDYKDYGGPEGPRNWLEKKIINKVARGEVIDKYEKGPTGEYTGYYSTGYAPGIFGLAQEYLGIPPGQQYTGFGKGMQDVFDYSDDDGDSGLASIAGGSGALQAGEIATPEVTPDDYYQRGVGTQTMDLADAAQRDAFLAGLYGTTPSPIGSRLDKEKGLLYLPDGTVVDIKTGKKIKEPRISGLDIFKPLQTYIR